MGFVELAFQACAPRTRGWSCGSARCAPELLLPAHARRDVTVTRTLLCAGQSLAAMSASTSSRGPAGGGVRRGLGHRLLVYSGAPSLTLRAGAARDRAAALHWFFSSPREGSLRVPSRPASPGGATSAAGASNRRLHRTGCPAGRTPGTQRRCGAEPFRRCGPSRVSGAADALLDRQLLTPLPSSRPKSWQGVLLWHSYHLSRRVRSAVRRRLAYPCRGDCPMSTPSTHRTQRLSCPYVSRQRNARRA